MNKQIAIIIVTGLSAVISQCEIAARMGDAKIGLRDALEHLREARDILNETFVDGK